MDNSEWRPHGAITIAELEEPYRNAAALAETVGNEEDFEEERLRTINLFEALLSGAVFHEPYFVVNPRGTTQTAGGDAILCDLAVRRVTEPKHRIFCFAGAGSDVARLEARAHGFCFGFLASQPGAREEDAFVIACTLIGTKLRGWFINARGAVRPMWSGPGGSLAGYRDVGDDAHKSVVDNAFGYMKSFLGPDGA